MGLFGLDWKFPVWTRNKAGQNFYDFVAFNNWAKERDTLSMAENHPLLTPALLFISKIVSQAEIKTINPTTKKPILKNPIAQLLEKPNWYQTKLDLLEELTFSTIANGIGVIFVKRTLGMADPNSLYVLNYLLLEFPDSLNTRNFVNMAKTDERLNTDVIYDKNGEKLTIKLRDLIFFYDVPNTSKKNKLEAVSRLTGISQTLINTCDSEKAKNIILKTNGKELISGTKEGFGLTPKEKEQVERDWQNNYGLGMSRKRGIITQSAVTWKSLHVIMRDLGHEESIKGDASIIFATLHLPQDVYSISGAKSTYKNANQSLISYIQNEIQPTLNSFLATLNAYFFRDGNIEFAGTYENMPVMLEFKTVKYSGITSQVTALEAMIRVGFSPEIALETCGFDKTIKLTPPPPPPVKEETKEEYLERIIKEANS